MMYDSKMALAVKANGRVLRENKDSVYMPFGCEYSLLIKNLNSVRAIVKIWIDGTDVTEGTSGVIVEPNKSVDLERFIKNGNLSAGNKFKFIERTAQISQHRGNKIDDGLIRVQFEFEQKPAPFVRSTWNISTWPPHQPYTPYPTLRDGQPLWTNDSHDGAACSDSSVTKASYGSGGSLSSSATTGLNTASSNSILRGAPSAIPQTEVGITVAGSESSQAFTWGQWFATDGVKHVMVLRMLGEVEGQPVVAPVTVDLKPTCTSCGKVNKANSKFCSECGTALFIIGGHEVRAY